MRGAGLRERPCVEAEGVDGTDCAARPAACLAAIRADDTWEMTHGTTLAAT